MINQSTHNDSTETLLKKILTVLGNGGGGGGGGGSSVLTTPGDMLYKGATTDERLPIGNNNDVLSVSGGLPVWRAEAGYIDAVINDPTELPLTIGEPVLDSVYLALNPSGIWFLTRKPAGLYVRVGNMGVDEDWKYLGTFPEINSSSNWLLYDGTDPTKELKFDLSGVDTATTTTLEVPNTSGTIALTSQLNDTQIFTSSGTWTKPAGAKMIHYVVIGGGGGGGGGRCDNAGTNRSGGGGGCAGGITVGWIDPSVFGATETITVGAGGTGGSGRSTVANGQGGSAGGVSSIGSVITTFTSNGGAGGQATSGSGGTGAANSARIYSDNGATNGGVNGSSGSRPNASAVFNAPTGGNGGSGISNTNVVSVSGAAADSGHVRTGALVLGGTAAADSAGGNGNSGGINFVGTGGGGGSPDSSTGAGNDGGNGGLYGGGGGGGSASLFPELSGAGGDGADGIVVITTYF